MWPFSKRKETVRTSPRDYSDVPVKLGPICTRKEHYEFVDIEKIGGGNLLYLVTEYWCDLYLDLDQAPVIPYSYKGVIHHHYTMCEYGLMVDRQLVARSKKVISDVELITPFNKQGEKS